MARCIRKCKQKRVILIGDMSAEIEIYDRDIASPAFGSAANQQDYTLVGTFPAAVETSRGVDIFDGVARAGESGVIGTATVFFYIRYIANITAEKFVQLAGSNFEILRVENLELANQWLKLYCAERGLVGKQAAL